MRRIQRSWALAAVLAAAMVCALAPGAKAQSSGSISGTILDVSGKPWAGLTVESVSEQGVKQDVTTDIDGKYMIRNLRPGIYTVTIIKFPPPNDKQAPIIVNKLQVQTDAESKADMNFKDALAKEGKAAQEQAKKQEEEKKKMVDLK